MLIHQGAEAKIYLEGGIILKHRFSKKYRHPEIDKKLRKRSTRRESRLLEKAKNLIPVPRLYEFDDGEGKLKMEYIEGIQIKEILDAMEKRERAKILKKIGEQVAILHNNNIIHGDLTTSNMLMKEGKIYFIDFGLGFFSTKIEDKAVDIHLFRQALESKHYKHYEESFKHFLDGYKGKINNFKEIMKRFIKVEERGRYKKKGGKNATS